MSTTTLYTLPGVPLHMDADNIQANWPVFVQMFIARGARLCQFEHTGGLLASVLPDAEFLAMFGVLPDTVVPDNPGVLAAAADAHIHRDQSARYRAYCSSLESLQMTFDAHMHPSLLLALRDPVVGLALTDLAGQFLHVRNVYGNLHPTIWTSSTRCWTAHKRITPWPPSLTASSPTSACELP
jgi:hypothetical protein